MVFSLVVAIIMSSSMDLAYNASSASTSPPPQLPPSGSYSFTNTAKLPIETVKRLIAAVSRRPVLWLRNNNTSSQKRSDITPIWFEVGKDVNLPADVCRVKWGHLRDNFRKVYIRNNLSNETPSSWRFYNDMRFMEHAVHENIMRTSRTRVGTKKHTRSSWNENNNHVKYDSMVATEPICELSDSYDSELQPNFSDISSFFEDRSCPPQAKRVKLEPNGTLNSLNEEELNDDDFDEDAASENEEKRSHAGTPDPSVFTIEVLDDDEEMEQPLSKRKSNKSNHNFFNGSLKTEADLKPSPELPFKYMSMEAATNTESNGDCQEDADRMFLLSLMPFLQRLDERRKLRVRQKLQNVLIEELEFS
ncbi:uncharacterized protein LOC108595274 [Drosophila busckii]|uniref:uncharacterized protein LOC108595274 n=1 Tax=Drosophila busckii TaxID=30019 RepID=UPI00083F28FF|nr:uncharacterized protein LOC108595274 [Drosophila busckii]